ncbi:hypothetical protein ABH39_11580 [Mycobacterium haemophilum]|nr:hypothetical protein ABH39_11580 [Mycobacterium haemophilum]
MAVQVVWSSRRGSRKIEHLGSTHDETGVAVLRVATAQRLSRCRSLIVLDAAINGLRRWALRNRPAQERED